jgi:hypothetical protein
VKTFCRQIILEQLEGQTNNRELKGNKNRLWKEIQTIEVRNKQFFFFLDLGILKNRCELVEKRKEKSKKRATYRKEKREADDDHRMIQQPPSFFFFWLEIAARMH